MKKKTFANIIMVALILVIAAAGILTAGYIQGWFDTPGEGSTLTNIRGIVTLTRDGVAFPATADTALHPGDEIFTDAGATASIKYLDAVVRVDSMAQIRLTRAEEGLSVHVSAGEVFIMTGEEPVTVTFEDQCLTLTQTVAALSVRSGAQSLSVFSGSVSSAGQTAQGGNMLSWVTGTVSVQPLAIQSLNDFTISCVRTANESAALCFSNAELDKLEADRIAAMQAQLDQQLNDTTGPADPDPTEPPTDLEETVADTSAPSESQPKPTDPTDPPHTEPDPTEPGTTEPPTVPTTQPPATAPDDRPVYSCTITIRCDTILDNIEDLTPSKTGYVPSDGMILYPITVNFTEGETVFDVLKRVCSVAGIQLEYSWTPLYGSYYIEGINHLYEFDCGEQSGWMYKVNEWFPNYGCSSYYLEDGDVIVWCYTCSGLGADVGGPAW